MNLTPTHTPPTRQIPEGFRPLDLGKGYGELFGSIYTKSDNPATILGFQVQPHHLNHFDVCHGGAIAFFADMQLIGVKHLTGDHDGHFPTRQLSIDFIAPLQLGQWVEMSVELVRVTRNNVYTHGIISVEGRCSARTTAIYHMP